MRPPVVESRGHVRTPQRYRNEHGQLLEHSPFCERDIRAPEELPVHDEVGELEIITRVDDVFQPMRLRRDVRRIWRMGKFDDIKVGDQIEAYTVEYVKRTL